MSRRPVLATLLVVSCMIPIAVAAPPVTAEEVQRTAEELRLDLASFDHIWTTIRDKHWDPELGGLDWEAIREELRPRVERAAGRDEVRAAMDDMISRLEQSHFAVIPAEIYEDLGLAEGKGAMDGTTGIDVRVVEGRALVTSVEPGSPAAEAGARPGWVVLRVGDDDIPEKLRAVKKEFEESSYLDLVLASAVKNRLFGTVGETVTVRFLDGEEREVDLVMTLAEQKGRKVQMGYLPPTHVWIEARTVEEGIGQIGFSMFIDPDNVMTAFNEAMRSFMDADGIIIDVRGNPGGLPMMAMGMTGWLVPEKGRLLGTMYTRDNSVKLVVYPRATTYDGPVAVLVDGLSGSCSEIFAGGLKDLGRARIFGSPTMGAVLPSVIEKLPNGDGFQYAFADYVSEGGERLEGAGVTPHVTVTPTREALLQGGDPAIDAAIAWIREKNRQTGSNSKAAH